MHTRPKATITPAEVRAIRRALGQTQAEFAAALGFTNKDWLNAMERGRAEITRTTELAIKGLLFELTRTDLIATCGVTNPKEAHHGPHEWDFQPIE